MRMSFFRSAHRGRLLKRIGIGPQHCAGIDVLPGLIRSERKYFGVHVQSDFQKSNFTLNININQQLRVCG